MIILLKIWWVVIIYLWWCNFAAFRNLSYRQKVSNEIKGIVRHEVAISMYDDLLKVGYWEVFFQPWKPPQSFYSKEINKLLK